LNCYEQLCIACRPNAPAFTDLTRLEGSRNRRKAMKLAVMKPSAKQYPETVALEKTLPNR
jgi:hypothetical protein